MVYGGGSAHTSYSPCGSLPGRLDLAGSPRYAAESREAAPSKTPYCLRQSAQCRKPSAYLVSGCSASFAWTKTQLQELQVPTASCVLVQRCALVVWCQCLESPRQEPGCRDATRHGCDLRQVLLDANVMLQRGSCCISPSVSHQGPCLDADAGSTCSTAA